MIKSKIKVGVNILNYELMGKKIREQRKLKNYTLEQLAEKLEVSTTFIGQIERAKGIPSLETVVKIANVLEVSVDYLLFANLEQKAINAHFIKEISELTKDFTTAEKQIILKNIQLFKEFKQC